MGLDTSHDAWHGPYGSFMDWRIWLAWQIDINLREMEGYGGGERPFSTVSHDIVPLLSHSDCDGELTPDECRRVAKGLREVLLNFENNRTLFTELGFQNTGDVHFYLQATERFIAACDLAASKNESIDFH